MKKTIFPSGTGIGRYGKLMVGALAFASLVGAPVALATGQGVASATTGVVSTQSYSYCSDIDSSYCFWLPIDATGVLSTTVHPASASVICDTYTGWYDNGSVWVEGTAGPVFTCNGNAPATIITSLIAGTPIQVGTAVADPGFNFTY